MQEIDLATRKPEVKKILLIGNEGVGKTHFIGTTPKPIYICSFDKGYDTLAGISGITVGIFMEEDRRKPKAHMEFKAKWDELRRGKKYKWPDGKEEQYKTIVIDSLTALSTIILYHEQLINNTVDKKPGFDAYGNLMQRLEDYVTQGVQMAEHFVCTALLETTKDDATGEIFFSPSTEGKFREKAGQWFDAVFFMQVDKINGEKRYNMLTVGDRRQKAKIRLPSKIANVVSAIENPTYEGLMVKINEALAQSEQLNQTILNRGGN